MNSRMLDEQDMQEVVMKSCVPEKKDWSDLVEVYGKDHEL